MQNYRNDTIKLCLEIKFSHGLRKMTIAEGSDAHFQVEVANKDVDQVSWEINGIPVKEYDRRTSTTSSGQTFSLVIHKVTKADEAAYSCLAGSAKSIARLYVEGKFLSKFHSGDEPNIRS